MSVTDQGSTFIVTHWRSIAEQWGQVGAPLRPGEADLARFAETVESESRGGVHGLRALVLGVTPEFYRLPWPKNTRLCAVDHTLAMIDALWPGPRGSAACAEWSDLPLADDSCDIVLCDGGLHLLAHPHEQHALVRALGRIIVPGGLCVLRLFVPASERESVAHVLAELRAGRVADLNALKFRLWMALHRDSERGVALRQVWEAVHAMEPDKQRLAAELGWSIEHLRSLDSYRDSSARYCFVTEAQLRGMFCESPGGFALESVFVPAYEIGGQCPIISLRRMA